MLKLNTKVGYVRKGFCSTGVLKTHVVKENVVGDVRCNKLQQKCLQPQVGFSLIELMVAVAIIGILAAIAIPNYQAFQRRARQTEARSLLSGIFTAQKAFVAEWGGGTSDVVGMGFYPEGQLGYLAGFADDATQATGLPPCAGTGANAIPARYQGQGLTLTRRHTGNNTGTTPGVCAPLGTAISGTVTCENISGKTGTITPGTISNTGPNNNWIIHATTTQPADIVIADTVRCNSGEFQAIAIGNIGVVGSGAGETRDDVWTINQDKILTNQLSGV